MIEIILQLISNSANILQLIQGLVKDKKLDPVDRAKIQLELMALKLQLKMIEEAEEAQLKSIKPRQPKRKP